MPGVVVTRNCEKVNAAFASGCWIRLLSKNESEIEILKTRNELSSAEFASMGHTKAYRKLPAFTPYSTATFVVKGLPVDLFGLKDEIGLIIEFKARRPIAYFYNGCHGETLTRAGDGDLNYDNEDLLKEVGGRSGGRGCSRPKSQAEIVDILKAEFKSQKSDSYYKENPDASCVLPWNEALFRYRHSDIIGICVSLVTVTKMQRALDLRVALEKIGVPFESLGFYSYDKTTGKMRYVPTEELIAKLKVTPKTYLEVLFEDMEARRVAEKAAGPKLAKTEAKKVMETVDASAKPSNALLMGRRVITDGKTPKPPAGGALSK